MGHIWPCLALLLLTLRNSVHGYMIDDDCGDDTQFVRARIDTAFRLISNAVTELNRNPINQHVDDWYNTLFGRPIDPSPPATVKSRFERLLRISRHNNNDQTSESDGNTDVRFYCTVKRIKKNKEGAYINKDRNIAYKEDELKKPGGRFAHCLDIAPPTLMVTLTVTGKYSEIQICPWLLRQARGFKIKDLTDIPSSALAGLSRLVMPVVAKKTYTPIDTFLLLDKVIVHELTHTEQGLPSTSDMEPNPYGFKNAQQLVSIWNEKNREAMYDPVLNADSNALFVVGAWILAQPGSQPIAVDGTFDKPRATPKAKI